MDLGRDAGAQYGGGDFYALDNLEEDQTLYCLCSRPSHGGMIACDSEDCEIEWFHVKCVGVNGGSVKRGQWHCPICSEHLQN